MIQPMKALTIYQPRASLLACGAKIYETRGWATNYRGPIAIHAATRPIIEILRAFEQCTIDAMGAALTSREDGRYGAHDILDLPRGGIIATAELVECYKIGATPGGTPYILLPGDFPDAVTEREILFGDWTPGRYAWRFANMKMLNEPIRAKGRQGLWNWEGVA